MIVTHLFPTHSTKNCFRKFSGLLVPWWNTTWNNFMRNAYKKRERVRRSRCKHHNSLQNIITEFEISFHTLSESLENMSEIQYKHIHTYYIQIFIIGLYHTINNWFWILLHHDCKYERIIIKMFLPPSMFTNIYDV